jgi:sugar lactone lactonase YvrE
VKRFFGALSMAAILAGVLATSSAVAVAIRPLPRTITLPGATSAEGLARGAGTTFYAGDLFLGDIYRGDIRTGKVTRFIHPAAGRNALGIRVDLPHHLLFVAGGFTGQGYVYNLRTGADVATFQFGTAGVSIINDVIVADGAAWFTDSTLPHLYRVPIHSDGTVGAFSTLTVTGPAGVVTPGFNLNGIAASPDGRTLIVAHSNAGALYTVNPSTGASALIAGASVPNVDGILFEAGRIFAVQNFSNQITELRPSDDLSSATVLKVIANPAPPAAPIFEVPTTVARFGDALATVNAKFDTGFPPTATSYEVVIVRR